MVYYRERHRSLYKSRMAFAPHCGESQPKTALFGWRSSPLKCLNFNGDIYKDSKDDSLVCIMQKGRRPPEHTEAMIKVMLAAFNNAVERKNG